MKIRAGFVSNSSSSSFIINMKDLSEEKIKRIVEWIENNEDSWETRTTTKEDGEYLECFTHMENEDWQKKVLFLYKLLLSDKFDALVKIDTLGYDEWGW